MATTEVIAADTAAGTDDHSIPSGTTYNYFCYELEPGESVSILGSNVAGDDYKLMKYENGEGKIVPAVLTEHRNTISVTGPADVRISKTATTASIEVGRYS